MELRDRRTQQASLQGLWSLLQPEDDAEDAQEKLQVTSSKLKQLVKLVDQNLHTLQQRLVNVQNPNLRLTGKQTKRAIKVIIRL